MTTYTTVHLSGGDLCGEEMLVGTDLAADCIIARHGKLQAAQ